MQYIRKQKLGYILRPFTFNSFRPIFSLRKNFLPSYKGFPINYFSQKEPKNDSDQEKKPNVEPGFRIIPINNYKSLSKKKNLQKTIKMNQKMRKKKMRKIKNRYLIGKMLMIILCIIENSAFSVGSSMI